MGLRASSVVPLRKRQMLQVAGGWCWGFQKDCRRTWLGEPYTLIQNEVKRTLRGRPLRRVKEAEHECPIAWGRFRIFRKVRFRPEAEVRKLHTFDATPIL